MTLSVSSGGSFEKMIRHFSRYKIGLTCVLAFQALLTGASAQEASPREIGVVYYAEGSGFKALEKEAAPASGRSKFSAKLKGAHATIRLADGGPQRFRMCSVDPARYRIYRLRSTKSSREVTITEVNIWIGGPNPYCQTPRFRSPFRPQTPVVSR
jgi:hypothetical protein